MMDRVDRVPEWVTGSGPDAGIVISTRARLARSLAGYPFPRRASEEELAAVAREVRAASSELTARFPELRSLSMGRLDEDQRTYLLDIHIASVEHISGGEGRVVILEPNAVLSIMVNEEDHLRVQSLMSGLVPEEAWDLVDWADDVLAQRLEYGFSDRYGYLTSSVSNVGTGLRISAMMHLAGMAAASRLGGQLRAAYDLGVSIRGLFGEGTRSIGDLFQVSNEVTLGLSEREIVERVRSVAQYLLDQERVARRELLADQRRSLVENATRALHKLRHSRAITAYQAISMMSPLRLAAESGLVEDCPRGALNECLVGMRAGLGEDGRSGMERAEFLRRKLATAHIEGY